MTLKKRRKKKTAYMRQVRYVRREAQIAKDSGDDRIEIYIWEKTPDRDANLLWKAARKVIGDGPVLQFHRWKYCFTK
jgi:hypothetical protein